MGARETDLLNAWLRKNRSWGVMLRNNTGVFLTLDGQRKVSAGLGKGTSDLIGWRSITVTPEMVGRKIAVFTAVEGKTAEGVLSHEQRVFIHAVRLAGGFAFVVRSEDTKPTEWE